MHNMPDTVPSTLIVVVDTKYADDLIVSLEGISCSILEVPEVVRLSDGDEGFPVNIVCMILGLCQLASPSTLPP